MSDGPVPVGWAQLAGAAALLLVDGALSAWLGLGLEGRLLVAGVRAVVQLTLLGAVLAPVMRAESPWIVAIVCATMVALGARGGAPGEARLPRHVPARRCCRWPSPAGPRRSWRRGPCCRSRRGGSRGTSSRCSA
ncbi:MAG: ABC transporter permease [Myxococcota bacterium]